MNRLKLSLFSCILATVLAALLLTAGGQGLFRRVAESGASFPVQTQEVVPPNGVATVSDNNVWAVGGDGNTLIEHWNGTSWQVIPGPGSRGATLADVAVVSASDIWAVGSTFFGEGSSQTITEVFC